MRLLDTVTGHFVEVTDSAAVEYAILSHTWDPKGEQSYQELRRIQDDYRTDSEVPPPPLSSTSAAFTPAPSSPAPSSSSHGHGAEPVYHPHHSPVGEKVIEAAEYTPLAPPTRRGSLLARKCRSVIRPILRLVTKVTTIPRRNTVRSRPIPTAEPAPEHQIWTSGPIVASPEPSTVRSASTSHAHDGEHAQTQTGIANSPFPHWAPRYYASPITPPPDPVVLKPYPIFDSPAATPTTAMSRIPDQAELGRYPSTASRRRVTTPKTPIPPSQYSVYPGPSTLAQYPIRADRSRNPPPQVHTPTSTLQQTTPPRATTPHNRIYGVRPRRASEHEPEDRSRRSRTRSLDHTRARTPSHSRPPRSTPTPSRRPSQRDGPASPPHAALLHELPTPPATPPRANRFWDDPRISEKVRQACAVARAHGHRLLWVDACCIDRTSSAELSEAVNSMFRWYRDASVCYVFMPDVPPSGAQSTEDDGGEREEDGDEESVERRAAVGEEDEGTEDPRDENSAFRHSRWFRRGWTLQELIAPRVVVFLSLDWRFLGTKASLAKVVQAVTGVDRRVLLHRVRLDEVSVAQRMAWAAERRTTRVEDEAYALLGIFGVNMPTLYGEGRRAFVRLQEEIVKRIPDQSLFTWGDGRYLPTSALEARRTPDSAKMSTSTSTAASGSGQCRVRFESAPAATVTSTLFADSPQRFKDGWSVRPLSHEQFVRRLGLSDGTESPGSELAPWKHATTPYGVHTQIPLVPVAKVIPRNMLSPPGKSYSNMYFALLACEPSSRTGHVMAVVCTLERARTGTGLTIATGGTWSVLESKSAPSSSRASKQQPTVFRVTALSPELLARCRAHLETEMLFMPLEDPQHLRISRPIWRQTEIRLAGWSLAILRELGYVVDGGRVRSRSYRYTFVKDEDFVILEFEYRDASEWSTEISVVVSPQPAVGSARRRSPLLGTHSPVPSPPCRLRIAEFDDAKECRIRLSSGRYLALVFTVHRSSSVLGYLDVQVLGEGNRESVYTSTTTSDGAGTSTLATSTGRSRSNASTSGGVSVGAVASARIAPARVDEMDEMEDEEPSQLPELDLEAEAEEAEEEEEMPSPAVSASSFQFLEEAEGRLSPARTR